MYINCFTILWREFWEELWRRELTGPLRLYSKIKEQRQKRHQNFKFWCVLSRQTCSHTFQPTLKFKIWKFWTSWKHHLHVSNWQFYVSNRQPTEKRLKLSAWVASTSRVEIACFFFPTRPQHQKSTDTSDRFNGSNHGLLNLISPQVNIDRVWRTFLSSRVNPGPEYSDYPTV